MKTAEEVAANIIRVVDHFALSVRESTVVQIVTAYADERVKEALKSDTTMSLFIHKRLLKEARAEALEEAAKVAEALGSEKQKCSPKNKDHHDAWCPTCESMEDAYAVIEEKIRALKESK